MRLDVTARIKRDTGFELSASLACDTLSLGVVGPSGSGKSTLLDSIAGIEPGARIVLDGEDCSRLPLHARGVGYVTQDALLFPHLSVRANLRYAPRSSAVDDVVEALRIGHLLERMPRNLSGGERRRVALGRAIVSQPRLLLLDEPFGGMDETRRREAMSLLRHVQQRFCLPMILVSHLADEVVGLTEYSIRLEEGRITSQGPSTSVLRADEMRIDNFFEGNVLGANRVEVDGIELSAMLPQVVAGRVRLACYAFDILLAASAPASISARNVFPTHVESLTPAGNALLVQLRVPRLSVLVTHEAANALALRAGGSVVAIVKATSIAYLGRA